MKVLYRLFQKKSAPPQRSGRGVLILVGGFLAASAIIRIADGSSMAFAREEPSVLAVDDYAQAPKVSPATQAHLDALLAEVLEREAAVVEREKALEVQIAASEMAQERIAEALKRLEDAERELRATMALADQAAENDLSQLTSVYENMKPQQAGPLFAQMSPEFAAGFLGRMRPEAAAAIMAGLEPETAYAISVILAGRNANVPRPSPSQ